MQDALPSSLHKDISVISGEIPSSFRDRDTESGLHGGGEGRRPQPTNQSCKIGDKKIIGVMQPGQKFFSSDDTVSLIAIGYWSDNNST